MKLAPQAVGLAAVPLKVTVLLPWVAPKFTPLIVTEVPGGPAVVDRLLILGAGTGAAFTTSVTVALWFRQPLVPVIVRV
jgi:hypothetical protein